MSNWNSASVYAVANRRWTNVFLSNVARHAAKSVIAPGLRSITVRITGVPRRSGVFYGVAPALPAAGSPCVPPSGPVVHRTITPTRPRSRP
jgi:hypothetical protein